VPAILVSIVVGFVLALALAYFTAPDGSEGLVTSVALLPGGRAVIPSVASRWTYLTEYLALHRGKPRVLADPEMAGEGGFTRGEWSRHSDLNRGPAVCESKGRANTYRIGSRFRHPFGHRNRPHLVTLTDGSGPWRSVNQVCGWDRRITPSSFGGPA
jgi:hypothetical protein